MSIQIPYKSIRAVKSAVIELIVTAFDLLLKTGVVVFILCLPILLLALLFIACEMFINFIK